MEVIIFKTRQADGKWKIADYYGKKKYVAYADWHRTIAIQIC